ncbi:N-formylglutamate amidohydrolase [Rhabdaerophilum sp. SD176]|uniref:N-formylglutamate amidohydrolase n=1 Tax=Rhabdaerophilum sp. SD176 TaxID=2983548 RepID=UPI0024E01EB3|nr:N-formylglutamate amidohydrolase [Rhabdaerophilum sp. SD176]
MAGQVPLDLADLPPFILEGEENRATPLFLNSPHSGDLFPAHFLARSQLARSALRRASDLYVDSLFRPLVAAGLPLMSAQLPRSYVDLNREPLELDPRLIAGNLPVDANTRSLRVAGGLGTIPRVIGDQVEIYAGKLPLEEALARIEAHYVPYHLRLHRELARRHRDHGMVLLLDLHSMPSQTLPRPHRSMPDLVIGDRFGSSAATMLVERLEHLARCAGFRVERNQPYAGGYITEHYGRPGLGWHAIQIEVNRALYMDEARLVPHDGFAGLSAALCEIVSQLVAEQAFDSRNSALHFSQKAAE